MEPSSDIRTIYPGNSQEQNTTESIKNGTPYKMSLTHMRACFQDIVEGTKVIFNLKTLEYILTDLNVNIKQLDPTLQQIIPYMLVSYIKSWPGWGRSEDYKNGYLKVDEYYEKFHKYVTIKLNYLIQKGYHKAKMELRDDSATKEIDPCSQTCVETQCQPNNLTPVASFSAFSINIEGPPKLLNTLIFGSHKNDVNLKMHTMKGRISNMTIFQLVNWPFIEIDFTSPYLKFSRKIIPHFIRYLGRANDIRKCGKPNFIETVKVNSGVSRTTYSQEFLKKYLRAYMEFLKKARTNPDQMLEICAIFTELFRDFEELSSVCKNGIWDSTSISFNMGGCRYVRNKKTAGDGDSDDPSAPIVAYCEVITPNCSIEFCKNELLEVAKKYDHVEDFPLISLFDCTQQQLDNTQMNINGTTPCILYSCFFCKKEYGGMFAQEAIVNHFQDEHCVEHAMMCCQCKKLYDTAQLVETRWFHVCELNPTAKDLSKRTLFD